MNVVKLDGHVAKPPVILPKVAYLSLGNFMGYDKNKKPIIQYVGLTIFENTKELEKLQVGDKIEISGYILMTKAKNSKYNNQITIILDEIVNAVRVDKIKQMKK